MILILDDENDTARVLTDAELDAMEAADLASLLAQTEAAK